MKKISIIILTLVLCGVCKAHVENYQSSNILSAQEAKYILEVFCRNYYSRCFEGKTYIQGTIIIKSVGVDQNTGGTYVSGLHSYKGKYIPFHYCPLKSINNSLKHA